MIIELNPINEFLITPAYKSIKIHLDNHLGIEISCINYIDYTKVPIPLLSYFRKSSSPLVSSWISAVFLLPTLTATIEECLYVFSCTAYLVTPTDLVTVC
jgi:hypothetical protein